MIEHLDRFEARKFLSECIRVIRPAGRLRLVVPDLALYINDYLKSGDADAFLEFLRVEQPRTHGTRRVMDAIVGFRGHRWMYDRRSLSSLLERVGFIEVECLEPGSTRISAPGALDLREREGDSIYFEARAPGAIQAEPYSS